MKGQIVSVLLFVLVLAGFGFYYYKQSTDTSAPKEQFTNSEYGISFEYPNTYELIERDVGFGDRRRHSIGLADREALDNMPVGGEGPTAITFDIFSNEFKQLSAEEWIRGDSFSNFTLSLSNRLVPTPVGGKSALSYSWDGLYRGESTVFIHGDNIVMATVTYLDENDQIRKDFDRLISAVELF